MAEDPGDRAVRFISQLTLSGDDRGKPFNVMSWQADIVRKLYGTFNEENLRKYRRCFLFVPRKNAKTEIASAIGTYSLLGTGETGQSTILAAGTQKQSLILFEKCVDQIQAVKQLRNRCKIHKTAKTIKCLKTGNTLQAISSKGGNNLGLNPSTIILDEMLVQKNRELYAALKTSQNARKQPLFMMISTAGPFDPESLIYKEYLYACSVRDGIEPDDTYLPIIYQAPDGSDWREESTWIAANPSLGIVSKLDKMREQLKRAKADPSEEVEFRCFYLNEWLAGEHKWLAREHWDMCGQHPVDYESLKGRECYGGLDLSATSDTTSLVLVFPFPDGTFKILPFIWLPREYARIQQTKGHGKYFEWERSGHITLTDGDVIDYTKIFEKIVALSKVFKIREIRADPFQSQLTAQQLTAKGLNMQMMKQGPYTMSEPVSTLGVQIAKENIHHGNHPVLNWMADNAVARRDSYGNVRLDKAASADKIDAVICLVMGLSAAMMAKPKVIPRAFFA